MANLTPNEAITSHRNSLAAHRHSPTTVDARRRAPKHFARFVLLRIVQIRALRLQLVQKCPKLQIAKDGQEVNLVSTQKRSCNLCPKPQSLHVTLWSIKVVTTRPQTPFPFICETQLADQTFNKFRKMRKQQTPRRLQFDRVAFSKLLVVVGKSTEQWTPAELAPNESSSALESKNQRSLLGFVRRCHRSHWGKHSW